MTDHLLREDCGHELLYNKQLNQEQYGDPVGREAGEGWRCRWGWRGSAGPGEAVLWKGLQRLWLHVAYVCATQVLMDSGQVYAQFINTPRYISCQSLSTCCLQKASMVLKLQSPSGSFQVNSSRTSHTFPDMDLLGGSPGPLQSHGLHTQPGRPAHCKKWPQPDCVQGFTVSWHWIMKMK